MNPLLKKCATCEKSPARQGGVVLFIALMALVVMSLAAVALVRSVDTSTIIAGNLAFKQSATSSADSGLEGAIAWLAATSAPNPAALNASNAAAGYYSNVNAALDLAADTTWVNGVSADAGTDATGNAIRYVIQRLCINANSAISPTNCLYGSSEGGGGENIAGDPTIGNSAPSVMYRVTARVTGPRNTVSYIQAFVY